MSNYFKWKGQPISVDIEDKQLTTKPKTFYEYLFPFATHVTMYDRTNWLRFTGIVFTSALNTVSAIMFSYRIQKLMILNQCRIAM